MTQTFRSPSSLLFTRLAPFLVFVPVLLAASFLNVAKQSNDVNEESFAQVSAPTDLYGLWAKTWPKELGDTVRSYYFHKTPSENHALTTSTSGIGLYRYGKLGFDFTHSFTWKVSSMTIDDDTGNVHGELKLLFKKTGEKRKTSFVVKNKKGRKQLELLDAPGTGYEKELNPPPFAQLYSSNHFLKAALHVHAKGPEMGSVTTEKTKQTPISATSSPLPFDRMWINMEHFKKGGAEFRLYQFQKPALDGRGVGWFHRGDFDNWSTEMLTYRLSDGQIELHFSLRNEDQTSSMRIEKIRGIRLLKMGSDPRNFWHESIFGDGGQSFIAESFSLVSSIEKLKSD